MNQQQLENASRDALDYSVTSLDLDTQDALRAARLAALQERRQNYTLRCSGFSAWLWSAGIACSAWLIFTLLPEQSTLDFGSEADSEAEFILLTSLDDTELDIVEDLDFAYWLSQHMETATTSGSDHNG